jgi:uncharacterized phage protein gp47/JayE
MSFAAEPYGSFVEDLLGNLTGGVSRVRFRFVEEDLPFRLGEHERVRPDSLRVQGIAGNEFAQFVRDRDYRFDGSTISWIEREPGVPAAGAVWPDPGTYVWVGFDRLPGGPAPLLNDRNPGSVVRTLAEAFAREFAVLSEQLDLVYDAAFVDTASGRDLEQIGALLGVDRRGATNARGQVVLRRSTPAPADIDVLAGTLVSTPQAPLVTVETTETATLRRGTLSVAVPVQSVAPGPAGVAAARSLTVLHRPILGVEEVTNPEPLSFGGGPEPDDELRSRIRRTLESGGRSTVGAIRGALASLEHIREQDVVVEEDHLAFPGLVRVTVAADLDESTAIQASRLLEEYRPAGVRIVHNLPAPTTPLPSIAEDTGGGGDGPAASGTTEGIWEPLEAMVTITPADTQLTDAQRSLLTQDVVTAVHAAVDAIGAGEPLIYNRIVHDVMAVDGVLDAVLAIGRKGSELTRFNLRPAGRTRPRLDDGDLTVILRGDRVVLDLTVVVERLGTAASQEAAAALAAIKADIEQRLVQEFVVTPERLSKGDLIARLTATEDYRVEDLDYSVELIDEGLRVSRQDVEVQLDPGQQIWVRRVAVTEEAVTG